MAVELDLEVPETLLPHDETAEDALERAMAAWQTARARLETVDPSLLAPAARETWFRTLARIGLWADARTLAARGDADEDDA